MTEEEREQLRVTLNKLLEVLQDHVRRQGFHIRATWHDEYGGPQSVRLIHNDELSVE